MKTEQLSIFDLINEKTEIPVLLKQSDMLWEVNKADIRLCTVCNEESWISNSDRFYRIRFKDDCFGIVSNETLGIKFFKVENYDDAVKASEKYIREHNVLLADDIELKNIIAFSYIRDVDSKQLWAYMAEIGNGLLYIKNFMTYVHIVEDNKKNRKKFEEDILRYAEYNDVKEIENYQPELKHMYLCRESSDWKYAEAGYGGTN